MQRSAARVRRPTFRPGPSLLAIASFLLAAVAGCGDDGREESLSPSPASVASAPSTRPVPNPLEELAGRLTVRLPPGSEIVRVFDRGQNLDVVVASTWSLDELVTWFQSALDPQVGRRFRDRLPAMGQPWAKRMLARSEYRMASYNEAGATGSVRISILEEAGSPTRQVTVTKLAPQVR
jgi:hypothetical protein